MANATHHENSTDLKPTANVNLATLRKYLQFIKPDWGRFVVLAIITVTTAIVPLLNPLIFRQIVDVAIPNANTRLLLGWSATSLGVVLVTIVFTYSKEILSAGLLQQQVKRLRMRTYDAYCQRSLDSMAAVPSGEPTALVGYGTTEAASLATTVGPRLVHTVSVVIAAGGVLFSVGVPIWLLAPMVGIVPLTLLAQYVARRIEHLMSESIDVLGEINTHISETTSPAGALFYRAGVDSKYDRNRFARKLKLYAQKVIRQARWHSSFGAIVGAYGGLSVSILFFSGGYFAIHGSMSTGDVVALATISPMVISPLISSSGIRTDAANSLMSFARITNILPKNQEISPVSTLSPPPSQAHNDNSHGSFTSPSLIEVRAVDLSKCYTNSERDTVLEQVTLTISKGDRVAVSGESGAGKSTLLKMLAGIDTDFTGQVKLNGVDARTLEDYERKSIVRLVSQDTALMRDSILENFRICKPNITLKEVWAALEKVGLGDTVAKLSEGLDTVLGSELGGLSGGQTARVGIAQAVAAQPDIIFLDEPFAHLDRKTGERILNVILEEIGTVILVTHQTEYTCEFTHHFIVEDGRVKEIADADYRNT